MKIVEKTRIRLQLKHQPLRYWFIGCCLFTVCLSFLIYCLFFKPVTTCTFYKSINKVFIERKSLRGNQVIEHPLENILRFDIQEKQFRYSKLYRAVIVLKFFKEIPINPQYTDERSIRYAVSRIQSFLKS